MAPHTRLFQLTALLAAALWTGALFAPFRVHRLDGSMIDTAGFGAG
jgi:hypothetical protein